MGFIGAVLALVGCNTDTVLVPRSEQFVGNGLADERVAGLPRRDALAILNLITDAPRLGITLGSNFPAKYIEGARVTVLVQGKYLTTLEMKEPGKQRFDVKIPGSTAGQSVVQLIEGTQVRESEQGPIGFTSVLQVATPKGFVTVVPARTKPAEGIVAFTDSRGVGGGYLQTGEYAWPRQLGKLRGAEVYLPGYCSLQLCAHIATAAGRDSLTAAIAKRLQAHQAQIVYVQAGVNDYAYATCSPAQLTEYYRRWLPQLREALPHARLFVETDGPKADEKPNALGFTLQQYREAEAAGAQGFASVVQGSGLWKLSDLADGTHLSQAGDTQRVPLLNAILNK